MKTVFSPRRMLALLTASLMLTLAACAPAATDSTTTGGGTIAETVLPVEPDGGIGGDLELTLDELAQYNGEGDMPAYIAVDGIIYDVSAIPQWEGGEHAGYKAGVDLTDDFDNNSPHERDILDMAVEVGTLIP